jgi:hypothetical protein
MVQTVKQPTTEKTQKEDKLLSLLVKLGTDPSELGRFIKDPDATMNSAGLSPEDQALLKSGNQAAIHSRVTGQQAPLLLVVDIDKEGSPSIRTPSATGVAVNQPPYAFWQMHGPVYTTPAWQMHGPVYSTPAWQMNGPVSSTPAWQMIAADNTKPK